MDGARKSAILLLSLDRAMAAELLGKLPREQVESVTLAIASAKKVTREEQEMVLEEFKAAFASRPLMHPAGPEAARELLEQTLEREEIDPIQQRIEDQLQAGPFAFLHMRHPDEIRFLVQDEHPQTIAVVAAQLPSNLAAQVLAGFPSDAQTEIVARLARIGPTDVDVLSEIASLLQDRIGRIPHRTAGLSRAANVLRETATSTTRTMLRSLGQQDANLAESLRDSLFAFKDLVLLDDETLRVVLQETDDCQWAIALKGCSDTLRQRILANLPPPMSQALKEAISGVGPLRLIDIAKVQNQIAEQILMLESANVIELLRKQPSEKKSGQPNGVSRTANPKEMVKVRIA